MLPKSSGECKIEARKGQYVIDFTFSGEDLFQFWASEGKLSNFGTMNLDCLIERMRIMFKEKGL
jgi:hypothetical protein